MSIFFAPLVNSYQVLVPHFQACHVVEKLLETNQVQFELNYFDNPLDPFFCIHSRVKSLKQKATKMLQLIETKYSENVGELSKEDRIQTVLKMKEYMWEHKIDHLKYLDYEEYWLEDKIEKFYQFASNYDAFVAVNNRLEEELDTLRVKAQICQKGQILEEFAIISGVCRNSIIGSLEKIIFRQSKGHSITVFKARKQESSSVFLCLINKNVYKHIGVKIIKSCEYNDANIYDLPSVLRNLLEYEHTLMKRLRESDELMQMSGKQLTSVLHDSIMGEESTLRQHLLRVSYLERLTHIICHSKQIGEPSNHILFTFHIPSSVQLPKFSAAIFPLEPSKVKPRTIMPQVECLKEVNILTELFSIPKHNEIIPSIFMFVTVPFLFGMMFSDFGHGILLLMAAFIFKLSPIFYLMAFMSIYCGAIYNEFFGMKIIRWGHLGIVQPVWAVSENGLNFQNSLKMKVSMIIAFFHMGFGMVLKIVNEKKKGQISKIFYDSLPKIGLLCTTVGYLVFLIVKKWWTNYSGVENTAPSIINSLLQLFLGWNPSRRHSILGSIETEHAVGAMLNKINLFLVLVLVYNQTIRTKVERLLCPILPRNKLKGYRQINNSLKPIQDGLDFQISQELQMESKEAYNSLQNLEETHYQELQHEVNELGPLEVFEFVLSLISSTTSYLRLFALSLAHAKLSSLILDMLLSTLSGPHPYVSLIRCLGFFCITIGMMLTLDVMECLMHVVRLHWVEWMGKFYTGSGKLFVPEVQHTYNDC